MRYGLNMQRHEIIETGILLVKIKSDVVHTSFSALQAEGRRFDPVNSHPDNQALKDKILGAFFLFDQHCDQHRLTILISLPKFTSDSKSY